MSMWNCPLLLWLWTYQLLSTWSVIPSYLVACRTSSWLKSYCSHESSHTWRAAASSWIDRQSSVVSRLDLGVPQGSVLEPLLFAVYVSSVGDDIWNTGLQHHHFADDTQIYIAVITSRNCAVDIKKMRTVLWQFSMVPSEWPATQFSMVPSEWPATQFSMVPSEWPATQFSMVPSEWPATQFSKVWRDNTRNRNSVSCNHQCGQCLNCRIAVVFHWQHPVVLCSHRCRSLVLHSD